MRLILLFFICITYSYSVSAQKSDSLIGKNIELIADGLKAKLTSFLPDTGSIRKGFGKIKDIIKHPASLKNVTAEYSREPYVYPFDSSGYYFSDRGNMNAAITVGGIPLMVEYRYLHFSDPFSGESSHNFSFKFDRDNYIQQLKDKLKTKYNPGELLQSLKDDVVEKAKNKALKFLQSEISEIKEKYKGSLNNLIAKAGDLKNILNTDVSTLNGLLLNSKFLESVQRSQNNLSQLQQRINLGEIVENKLVDSLKNILNQYKGLKEVIQKIQEHKSKWLTALLSENFKNLQALKGQKIEQVLNNPSSIRQLAREKLSLSGLQKLMLKAERLDIGQNALTVSPLSLQNFMSTGVNAEFFNKNKYFMITAGHQAQMNSLWDNPFLNNINSTTNKVVGMSFGRGNISSDSYSHFSLFTYKSANNINRGISDYSLKRSVIVATISNKIRIGERGSISAEISRSAMQYKNERNSLDSSLTNKTSLNNLLTSENFNKSLAFTVAYSNEYPKIGLIHEVEIKSVANGYYNPGNNFLPSGTQEIKVNIKKNFFERKFSVATKANFREYQFSNANGKKWQNVNYSLDARWKFRKGQFVGIRYQPLTMRRIEDKIKYNMNESDRLTAEGNIYKKIRSGLYYRNYVNLTLQRNKYQLSSIGGINNKSLLVISQQSIIIKKNIIFWNTSYNNVNNGSNASIFYFNTSLNSDAGFSFSLLKTFSASTSIGYRSVKNWYSQFAVRQTLSGEIGKNFSINIYVDAAKNIKLFQPLPYSQVRAEWSLKYMFKN